MKTKILLVFLVLSIGYIKAQYLSTMFVDTLEININNFKIYTSTKPFLRFIPSNRDSKLIIYNDSTYKLELNLKTNKNGTYSYLSISNINFSKNDSNCISSESEYIDSKECSDLIISKNILKSWNEKSTIPTEKIVVKFNYRLFGFAPNDTTNYTYNYRQGLWIGQGNEAKEVTVNYNNDLKDGLVQVIYDNNTSYTVNYKNNIADNYGMGYWSNYKTKKYTFPPIIFCDSVKLNGQQSFYFKRENRKKAITKYNDLSVYSEKKGLKNDSIEYDVRGKFMAITNDTMIIESEDVYIHNFYFKNNDSLHYHPIKTSNGFTKIPLINISKIYYGRDKFKTFTLRTTLICLATALIVSPLISIQKGGFNGDRFRKVTGTSLGVMVLSISFGIGFSQKEFLIWPTKKNKKTWVIKQDYFD